MTLKGLTLRYVDFMVNHVYVGNSHFEKKRRLLMMLGHEIGEGTRVVGPIKCTGKLRIGPDCWIGKNFAVNGFGTVSIGQKCDIAPGVSFQTGSHIIGDRTRRAGEITEKDVTVGAGTWICANSTIIGGVTIGEGCVVAACACVIRDVPADSFAAGVPAKVIKKLD